MDILGLFTELSYKTVLLGLSMTLKMAMTNYVYKSKLMKIRYLLFWNLIIKAVGIYSYIFDFDTFKNDTFKSVIFRYFQK